MSTFRFIVPPALLCALLLSAGSAFAWEPLDNPQCRNGLTVWNANQLPNTYNINELGYSQIPFDEVRRVFRDSWDEWARPCCSGWRSTEGPTTTLRPQTNRIQDRMMAFVESSWPSQWGNQNQTIAFVRPSFSGCTLRQAEMVFNAVGFRFTTSGRGTDLQAITTHEAGHWLGLDHSPIPQATMYFAYQGGTGARTLHPDDEEGVCSLYPRDCSCSRDSDCSLPGEVCIDNICRVPPCGSNADCPGREECDGATGQCFLPPCTSDGQCGREEVCQNGQCVIDTDCTICASCTSNNDCSAGELCAPGQNFCTRSCSGPGDCPGDSQCFQTQFGNFCLNPGAASAGICPRDYVCRSNTGGGGPVNPCEGVICATDMVCNAENGRCVPDRTKTFDECAVCERCTSNAECGGNGQCLDIGEGFGRCIFACQGSGDCPGNSACFQVPTQGGGSTNICLNDNAQGGGVCPGDYECLAPTGSVNCPAGQVPDPISGDCVADNGGGETPDDAPCDVCRRCNSDDDCMTGSCQAFGPRNYCITTCSTNADCPGDSTCAASTAFDDRICLNPNAAEAGACPSDYTCSVPPPPEPTCDVCRRCTSDDDCISGTCQAFGSRNYCITECSSDDECPGNSACLASSAFDSRVCLNSDAADRGACHADYVCVDGDASGQPGGGGGDGGQGQPGGGGGGPDLGDGDGGATGADGPDSREADCGGCAAGHSPAGGWLHLLVGGLLLGALRRRGRFAEPG